MKLYPYSKIRTENLKSLLLASRVLGVLSYILFIITFCVGIFSVFGGPTHLGNGMTMAGPSIMGPTIMILIWGIVSSVCVLAFSGLCAAVVSCEHKFTTANE